MTHIVHLSTVHKATDNRVFHKECAGLAKSGYRVTLVATDAGVGEREGVQMWSLPKPKSRLARLTLSQFRSWRALGKLRPDVLQIHDPELIPMAVAWAKTHRVPLIYDAHEDLVGQIDDKRYLKPVLKKLAKSYAKLLLKLADKFCDAIITATPIIAAKFNNANKTVLYNYPWLSDYPTPAHNEVEGRVVYLGWLTKGRQFNEMVAAVRQAPSAHFVCAGPADATAKTDLQAAIDAAERFEYLGVLTPSQLPEVLATAKLGLVFLEKLPNYETSLPTKLFEYLAAGIPFVASDFEYFKEMFAGWDAGIFVDTENVTECAEAIEELLSDETRRAQMGINGRRAIEEKFNFERELPKLVDLNAKLVASS